MQASSGIRRDRRGDAPDFDQLFEDHGAFVWRVLKRFGVADRDLPDVCQDVFVVVLRKLDCFEGRSAITTWLYSICARTASDYRRRAHRRHEHMVASIPDRGAEESQITALQSRQVAAIVDSALVKLSDTKRRVFVMYEFEQRSMPEIAGLMETPLQTAFSRLYAARRAVNEALRRSGCAGVAIGLPPSWLDTGTPSLLAGLTSKLAGGAGSACTASVVALALVQIAIFAVPHGAMLGDGSSHQMAMRMLPLPLPTLYPNETRAELTEVTDTKLPRRRSRRRLAPSAPRVEMPATVEPAPPAAPAVQVALAAAPVQPKPRVRRAAHDPVDEILFTTSVRALMRVDTALVDDIRQTMPVKRVAGWTRVLEVGATANDSSRSGDTP